jgi:ferritin-like metal-binding protein YciE
MRTMEQQAEAMMTSLAERIENYPDLRQMIQKHIDETRQQAQLVESGIKRRGGDVSAMKDMTGKMTATVHGWSSMMASDEIIKGGMLSYAFEHFEIASYRNLIEGAHMLGDRETMEICERILAQEQAMASYLEHNMAAVTRRFLELSAEPGMGTQASR